MILEPLKIGNVVVDPPVFLAPMAGVADSSFRILCLQNHCGAAFTELANAPGVARRMSGAMYMLETVPGERPLACHMCASEPDIFAAAAAVAADLGKFDFVDLNCGCPVRRVVARGAGVALMRDPDKIGNMVRAARAASPLPVTIKTRLGISDSHMNISEIAQAAEEAGAAAIFLHARVAKNKHSGAADWATLASIRAERSIPVVGNGGVTTPEAALDMVRQTGVAGVMIGRAAIGNPWIFSQIFELLHGRPAVRPSAAERIEMMRSHFERLCELKRKEKRRPSASGITPEKAAAMRFRMHLFRYLPGASKRELCFLFHPDEWLKLWTPPR